MNAEPLCYPRHPGRAYNVAVLLFVATIVLNGTYFRLRASDSVPDLDWLVIARLFAASAGILVGAVLMRRSARLGFGAKVLSVYALAACASAITSPYPVVVLGYCVLFVGAAVLVAGIISSATNVPQFEALETVWFVTVAVLLVKDTATSLLYPEMQTDGDVARLGMGVTHATTLSLHAALLFWMSFKCRWARYSVPLWLLRAVMLFVLLAARSRVSIAAFVLGGLLLAFLRTKNALVNRTLLLSAIGVLSTAVLLSASLDHEWARTVRDYLQRGQVATDVGTFTGRTVVWQHVLTKSLESPLLGHGYAVSRLTIGVIPANGATPAHCHNELLEVFFNTGAFGLVPFLIALVYNGKWVVRHGRLGRVYSADSSRFAVCLFAMLLLSSVFEARLGGKLEPVTLLFFIYLLALDQERPFSTQFVRQSTRWETRSVLA